MQRPNIVLIMTDQQRRNSLGVYGNRYVDTPNLDGLAGCADVYDHCYCSAPICTPSRACTMTGKSMMGCGVYNLFDILPAEEKMLPWYLHGLGYATALIGKLHVSGIEFENEHRNPGDGFDVYKLCHEPSIHLTSPTNAYGRWLEQTYPEEYQALLQEGRKRRFRSPETHFTTWVCRESADYIRSRDKTRPFFLSVGLFDPHNPYFHYPKEAEERLHEEFRTEPIPGDREQMPQALREEREKFHYLENMVGPGDTMEDMRRGYFAGVTFIDMQLKMIIDALKEEKIYDDTMIVFTSDHGDMLGDHDLFSKGLPMYEDGVNVPLIVKYPHQQTGRRMADLVMLQDLFSTIYVAAGGDAALRPESIPLQGPAKRSFAMTQYRGCGNCDIVHYPHPMSATMIRTAKWKLMLYHDSGEAMLFDMENDPLERHDLSADGRYGTVFRDMVMIYLQQEARRECELNMSRGGLSKVPSFAKKPNQKEKGANQNAN